MTDDFYDLLGVGPDASQEEIRKAFRRQVRVYHPDLNDDPRAPAQFTALKKAYDTLGDPKEREDYDRMGHDSYVAKRINGLPSPDEWEIPEKEFGGEPAPADDGGTAGTTGSSSAAATGAEKRRRERSRTAGDSSTARSSGSNGTSDGTGGRSARTAGSNPGAGARNGAASATATGTSGGGTARRSTGNAGGESTTRSGPLENAVDWIQGLSLGWPLIGFSDALYLAGLAIYLADNAAGTNRLVERLGAAALGPGSIREVLGASNGIVPLSEYIVTVVAAESFVGGVFLILGMAFIPSVYFFIIHETRRIRTPWQPSYLYVLGALGPVVGLVLNATTAFPGLYLDIVCYVLLPLGSIVGLPFSAFVRPRLRRTFRKTVRRFTD